MADETTEVALGGPIRIGVSACLLGQTVRWDGGHKRDRFVTDQLARWVEFVSVCPEVESGLPTPRPTLRLAGEVDDPRLIFGQSGDDHTEPMKRWAQARVKAFAEADLCGFILKSDSPSCGMERVRVYNASNMPARKGTGLFARELMRAWPLLPVEEEGRLNDPKLRETFVERVFAYRRWRDFAAADFTPARLVDFHRVHKYLLLAHSPEHYASMGRLVAERKALGRAELRERYATEFMLAMARHATRGRHHNVLQHMAGYFKRDLDAESKAELHSTLEDYRLGLVPLVVPLTLLRHHVRARAVDYLADQVYLAPHPKELMLRNHV